MDKKVTKRERKRRSRVVLRLKRDLEDIEGWAPGTTMTARSVALISALYNARVYLRALFDEEGFAK